MESIFQQATRLLKALKMDTVDSHNNEVALALIKKYGNYEAVFREIAKEKYDRLRYTPDIMLSILVKSDDDHRDEAGQLAEKLHTLRTLILHESNAQGVGFSELLDRIDVVQSLSLTLREAWAVKFAGGKEFIERLSRFPNGDSLVTILSESLVRADDHLSLNHHKSIKY